MKVYELREWLESYPDNAKVWIADYEYAEWYELTTEFIEVKNDKPSWSVEYGEDNKIA